MYKVSSPVLFIIFNRPEETKTVFEAIKLARPSKLYVAADGARPTNPQDELNCKNTRNLIKDIDWDCELFTLFRDQNLGCRDNVSKAITWFFENEPEGIILEDDCLPSEDFFIFCDLMLDYYRYDNRIAHICGSNFQKDAVGEYSYYFSKSTHVWGWASWRRVWDKYDVELKFLDTALEYGYLNHLSKKNQYFINDQLVLVRAGIINTWDYQYMFSNLINNFLAIMPNNNMISNIGFNQNATHTTVSSWCANLPFTKLELPLKHPPIMLPNNVADNYSLDREVPPLIRQKITNMKSVLKNKVKKLIK